MKKTGLAWGNGLLVLSSLVMIAEAQTSGTLLTSGVPSPFSMPATPSGIAGVGTGDLGFRIVVPIGVTRLEIRLVTTTPNADADVYVRFGTDITVVSGTITADYSATSPYANETLTITPSSSPPLEAGTYYVAIGVPISGIAVTGTITATADNADPGPLPPAVQPWQSDWNQFVDLYSPYLRSLALDNSTAKCFVMNPKFQQPVTWSGVVKTNDQTQSSSSYDVKVSMPTRTVALPNGRSITLDELGVFPNAAQLDAWKPVKAGTSVQFHTTVNGLYCVIFVAGAYSWSESTLLGAELLGPGPTTSQNGVVSGASFVPGIVPNSWITIQGTNLSAITDTWEKSIVNGNLPTTLDGVSVSIGGNLAYIYYISPGQINAVAPDVGVGNLLVTVTNSNGTSLPLSVISQTVGPGFFLWTGKYAVATRQDYSWAVKNGTFQGVTTTPAKPGDVIILWGTGFGPTNPAAPVGVQIPADKTYLTTNPVSVTVGGLPAQVYGAALAPGFAGLYQVAIQIPPSAPDGDLPVVATIGGTQSLSSTLITVQH